MTKTEVDHVNGADGTVQKSNGHANSDGRVADDPSDEDLFPADILINLDLSLVKNDYKEAFGNYLRPGQNLQMRPLRRGDFARGYVELLSQLAVVGNVTKEAYEARFDSMKACPDTYYTIVLEDDSSSRIVGAVTLVVEQKFIHTAALRGRIEDVVVHRERRGQDLGKLLMDVATILSRELGCYKTSLECKDALVPFYNQFGYHVDVGNNYMIQRFRE